MASNELDYITVRGFKSIESIEKLALITINVIIGLMVPANQNSLEYFLFFMQ